MFFLLPKNLVIVPVSNWLEKDVKQSFFKEQQVIQIYNGIDIKTFTPYPNNEQVYKKYNIQKGKNIILGVASNWYRKGLDDFIKLANEINDQYIIILVGLNKKELKALPEKIIGIARTENLNSLIELYSAATVFFNPTWEDNFPTTNLEAMACGTPVITYNTGGSPEAIQKDTGFVIEKGDIESALEKIDEITKKGKSFYREVCRTSVIKRFNKDDRYNDYFELYCKMLNK